MKTTFLSNRVMLLVTSFVALVVAAGCDPVHDALVDQQGDDPSGQRNGPLHRAGEPCDVCHGGSGPAHATFTLAGTVYRDADSKVALVGALVKFIDADGKSILAQTNEAGNFYLTPDDYAPTFPVQTTVCTRSCDVADPLAVVTPMKTHIGREGSCALCHSDPPSPTSAGHVYLLKDAGAP